MILSSTVEKLNRHFAEQLGCDPDDLDRQGLGFVSRGGDHPASVPPLWALIRGEGGVVSVSSSAYEPTNALLAGASSRDLLRHAYRKALFRRLQESDQAWFYCHGLQLYCDSGGFTPQQRHEVRGLTAEDLPYLQGQQIAASHESEIRDRRVFAVLSGDHVVSYATVRAVSDWCGEVTVATEAAFRRQGMGKSVVTVATRSLLEEGRIAVYSCDALNQPSFRLAASLGYRKYADDFACVGRPNP